MLLKFGSYYADIDTINTRIFYNTKMAENSCTCTGCTNFKIFAQQCSSTIKKAFAAFGIDDIKKVYEITPYDTSAEDYNKHGGILYGGFFPVVGKILNTDKIEPEKAALHIDENFEFFISPAISLCPPDFPKPTLQIEIYAYIPWFLNKQNDYLVY